MKGEVEDRAKYACSLCDFDTEEEEDIKLHMDSHEICMVFSCKHCSYQVRMYIVQPVLNGFNFEDDFFLWTFYSI